MGMLFDHGLDATSSIVVMYQIGRIHNVGGGFDLLLFIYLSSVSFYYFTLTEYYMGKMILPMFSGPDDTSVGISIVCFITAYLGPAYWAQETDFFGFENLKRKSILLYSIACFQLPFAAVATIANLIRASKSETFEKRYKPFSFFLHVSYGIFLALTYIAYTQFTGSTVLVDYPKLTTMAYGGQFLKATLLIMVSSAAHQDFNPYSRTMLLCFLLLAINATYLIGGRHMIDEFWLMTAICAISWGAMIHFVYNVMS